MEKQRVNVFSKIKKICSKLILFHQLVHNFLSRLNSCAMKPVEHTQKSKVARIFRVVQIMCGSVEGALVSTVRNACYTPSDKRRQIKDCLFLVGVTKHKQAQHNKIEKPGVFGEKMRDHKC